MLLQTGGGLSYLLIAQPKVSDDQHVRIIPVARASVRNDIILVVPVVIEYALERSPRVLDVVEVAPQVTMLDD